MKKGYGSPTTIATRYEYDHMGRKIGTFESINGVQETSLAHLVYDEIGQLREKKLHNDLQTTYLSYNERGWLKTSSSNEFSMELVYNDAPNDRGQTVQWQYLKADIQQWWKR